MSSPSTMGMMLDMRAAARDRQPPLAFRTGSEIRTATARFAISPRSVHNEWNFTPDGTLVSGVHSWMAAGRTDSDGGMQLLLLLTVLQTSAEPVQTPAPAFAPAVFHGRRNQTDVALPRLETDVVIDGILDEDVWRRAAVLTGFSQFSPVDGRPADDSTDVLVWYAPTAIYFGIRAFADPGTVRATLADRDKLTGDDFFQILLDTFDDGRQALVFAVNPLGVQADGVRTESQQGARRGNNEATDDEVDLSPDFVFESRGRLTEWGYAVEVRIPFKSIRYRSVQIQRWRLNILRKVQATGYEHTWTPARRANASFLAQSGRLLGLRSLSRGLVLDINPETTAKIDGTRGTTGWDYETTRPELGGNVRWGVTTNLSLAATANPDFSNIEADVAQAPSDPRFAVSFPEKRPFFLEGSEQFAARNSLIYTRRIADPVGALKLAGKASGINVGLLSAVDARITSATGNDYPVFNVLRLKGDLGPQSSAGVVYTDRIEGSDYNRLAVTDARLVFGGIYSFEMQAGQSFTRTGGVSTRGPIWEGAIDRNGRRFGFNLRVTGIHPDFEAQTGFIRRRGFIQPSFRARHTVYGRPGAALERYQLGFFTYGYWRYDDFFGERVPYEHQLGFQNNFVLRGGWGFRINPIWESIDFDPDFFADYGVERQLPGGSVDTVGFLVPGRIHNWGISGGFSTPQLKRFAASFGGVIAHDIAWFERREALLLSLRPAATWRPSDRIRIEAQHTHLEFRRFSDWSKFITADIPRLKVEYQVSRPLFVRLVAQYEARIHDAFRDPRTEEPILIRPGPGLPYEATQRSETNRLRVDWLFSYRPNPGTVLFLGYGSSLDETSAFSFRNLSRTSDGFFAKLSYLFRM